MLEYSIVAHAVVASIVTIAIVLLDYSERRHAFAQILLAWLVPFIGPIVVSVFLSVVHRNMTTPSEPLTPDDQDRKDIETHSFGFFEPPYGDD